MASQGQLFEGEVRDRADGRPSPPPKSIQPDPAPVWLQRMSLIVLVLFCFYVGALLTVMPWSPRYWDDNGWIMAHAVIGDILRRGWVRGVVSGIGLLDVWIGVSELLHYRDYRA